MVSSLSGVHQVARARRIICSPLRNGLQWSKLYDQKSLFARNVSHRTLIYGSVNCDRGRLAGEGGSAGCVSSVAALQAGGDVLAHGPGRAVGHGRASDLAQVRHRVAVERRAAGHHGAVDAHAFAAPWAHDGGLLRRTPGRAARGPVGIEGAVAGAVARPVPAAGAAGPSRRSPYRSFRPGRRRRSPRFPSRRNSCRRRSCPCRSKSRRCSDGRHSRHRRYKPFRWAPGPCTCPPGRCRLRRALTRWGRSGRRPRRHTSRWCRSWPPPGPCTSRWDRLSRPALASRCRPARRGCKTGSSRRSRWRNRPLGRMRRCCTRWRPRTRRRWP